ncbi:MULTISPECIES: hypothetical protein [unclassified Microcoleus]|uniref:hypothetical protein n=1 Tax=unclassified Microcoleus TaxID=2642155 RepID=UPI002FD3FAEF
MTTFSRATGDRSFCIQRSRALDDFFTRDGRSLFLVSKDRDPFTTSSQGRSIALLAWKGR